MTCPFPNEVSNETVSERGLPMAGGGDETAAREVAA